jgi:hypothetical protein
MRITLMLALAGTVLLSGCSYGDAENSPAPIRDREAKILAKELKGKVAGEPQNCISTLGRENMIRISDDMLLYRQSGRLVYQNKLRSPCPGLARDSDVLVTESFGGQLCRGDIVRLVDRTSGMPGPVCSLGEFVPYRTKAD